MNFTYATLLNIKYEAEYLDADSSQLSRYFAMLLEKYLAFLHGEISCIVPKQWVLTHNFSYPAVLSEHQIEREIIIYFQYNFAINLHEYEFIISFQKQKAIAIKKNLFQNINAAFIELKLNIPNKIITIDLIDMIKDDKKGIIWIKFY